MAVVETGKAIMILLMTSSTKADGCVDAITLATSELVKVASTAWEAATFLRDKELTAVIIDQQLQDIEADAIEQKLSQIGLTASVYVNLAISGAERVVRDLRIALHRRERETVIARRDAEQKLRNELKDVVTALLLSCDMALQMPALPSAIELQLRAINGFVQEIQKKISPNV